MTARASSTLLYSGPSQRGGATASGGGHSPTNDAFSADHKNESDVRLQRGQSEGRSEAAGKCQRAPVRCNFVVPKGDVPLLNDSDAAIDGDGHCRAIGYGIVD